MIRAATMADCEAIGRIYNHYVRNTVVTFEELAIPSAQIGERLEAVQAASLPWLVAEQDGHVLGYAYASRWIGRSGYRFTVESTVYLDSGATGRGLGSMLYGALLSSIRERGAHMVVAAIALPNPASVALHEKCGFGKVAHFSEIGFKFGRWVDIGYWQRSLENK
jgi:L-amino acid N-acyltransferase YncA